ncbi:interleukin-10 receptor subunit beta isoform X2 [Vidua chalybeata]|nr:interleukin-10 receptor subunit beta isoform X2 [Vidua chalybeata]
MTFKIPALSSPKCLRRGRVQSRRMRGPACEAARPALWGSGKARGAGAPGVGKRKGSGCRGSRCPARLVGKRKGSGCRGSRCPLRPVEEQKGSACRGSRCPARPVGKRKGSGARSALWRSRRARGAGIPVWGSGRVRGAEAPGARSALWGSGKARGAEAPGVGKRKGSGCRGSWCPLRPVGKRKGSGARSALWRSRKARGAEAPGARSAPWGSGRARGAGAAPLPLPWRGRPAAAEGAAMAAALRAALCGGLLLCVSGMVPEPQNVRITSVNLHSTLQWDAPRFPRGNLTYTVRSKSIYYPGDTYETLRTGLRLPWCDVSSLSPYGSYVLQLRAEAGELHSPWVTLTFKPMDDTSIGPPEVRLKSESGALHVDVSGPFAEHEQDRWPLRLYYGSWRYRILYWKKGSRDTELASASWV